MIVTRTGNKRRIAPKITPLFPPHEAYIELFFGGGGMYFNKKLAPHSFLNDSSGDVYNLWLQVQNNRHELEKEISLIPYSDSIFKHFMENEETDPLKKAVRFLYLSNFSYLGKMDTLRYGIANEKQNITNSIERCYLMLKNAKLFDCDFRNLLPKIAFKGKGKGNDKARCFIYADPPYLGSDGAVYDEFTEDDSRDLFDTLEGSNIRWACLSSTTTSFYHKRRKGA